MQMTIFLKIPLTITDYYYWHFYTFFFTNPILNFRLLTDSKPENFKTCLLTNVSECALSENQEVFVITVYNPLSRPVNKYVRVPVHGTAYTVTGPDGKSTNLNLVWYPAFCFAGQTVRSQIIPIANGVQNIIGRTSTATLELIFEGKNIPPLGFKSFHVKRETWDQVLSEDLALYFSYKNDKVQLLSLFF